MRAIEWAVVIAGACIVLIPFIRTMLARERARHQFDRVRIGSSTSGIVMEVIDPPFWRIDRQLLKRKTTATIDFMMNDEMGTPRLKQLRARPVENPKDVCPLCKRPYRRLP